MNPIFRYIFPVLLAAPAFAQAVAPAPVQQFQFFADSTGRPLAGGKVCSYAAGTTTPLVTYGNSAATPNTNPVILDANGRAGIWLGPVAYKIVLRAPGTTTDCTTGAIIYSIDGVFDPGQKLRTDLAATGTGKGATLIGFAPAAGSATTVAAALTSLGTANVVIACGADPTGVADSLAAFDACYASNDRVFIPNGTYTLSGVFAMARSNTAVTCESPGAIIRYTASGALTDLVRMGAVGIYNQLLSGCTIKGNSHVTNALTLNHVNHTTVSNVRLKDASVCLFHDTGVSNRLDSIECSVNNGGFTVTPVTGLKINASNTVQIDTPTIEGVSGTGIAITGSSAITRIGGTSEANAKGNTIDGTSTYVIINGDDESNSTSDVEDSGTTTLIGGIYTTLIRHLSTAIRSSDLGVTGNAVTVDAGAKYVTVANNDLGNFGGGITDNGTCTTIFHNVDEAHAAALLPDKGPCTNVSSGTFGAGGVSSYTFNSTLTSYKAINQIESETGANNALVAALTDTNGTAITLTAGLKIHLRLQHTLQAGANTLNLNGTGAVPIVTASGGGNLTRAYGVINQVYIDLTYAGGGGAFWADPTQ